MIIKQQLTKEQNRLRRKFDELSKSLKLDKKISSDWIVNLVHEAGERWGEKAHLHFQKEISKKLSRLKKEEDVFSIIELAFQCWNYFPHKDMGNKTPFELAHELAEKQPPFPAKNKKTLPTVVVGDQKMSFQEYQAMLEEMERVQVPFRAWLKGEVLPKYKLYLETNFKKKTIEKHYSIADILCDRLFQVGFISPEHVRPDFLYVDFPIWWQTHVMFGNYNETTVENSVIDFMNYIDRTTGVVMDNEEIESNPEFYL